jgi:hypothetical protein
MSISHNTPFFIFMLMQRNSYITILCICIGLFVFGIKAPGVPVLSLLSVGIGAIDPKTFITWGMPSEGIQGLLGNVFVANSPQPILSSIYYTYNGLFTCFLLGAEWNGFARDRKGLRISGSPRGAQRSSYTLQLPKRWALPLMALSALLHWLCSQSIYLVSIDIDQSVQAANGNDISTEVEEFLTCGYSPKAILCTILVGITMLITAILVGRRQFRSAEIPGAGSCSASISACCHLSEATSTKGNVSQTVTPIMQVTQPGHPMAFGNAGWGSYGQMETEQLLNQQQQQQQWQMPRNSAYSMHGHYPGYSYEPYSSGFESNVAIDDEPESAGDAPFLPVKWGVTTSMDTDNGSLVQRIGHCSFSSREVGVPHQGELYAG